MKKVVLFGLLIINTVGFCQTKVTFGKYTIEVRNEDVKYFNLFDTWRVIHREYIIEADHTYESILLNEKMNGDVLRLYKQRKKQGELIYGKTLIISKEIFYPPFPYMSMVISNPIFKNVEYNYEYKEKGIFPQLNSKKMLKIEISCPQNSKHFDNYEPDVVVEVLNKNMICIGYNNSYTFLERVIKDKNKSEIDRGNNTNFHSVKMQGFSDFQLLVDKEKIKENTLLFVFNKKRKNKGNFLYIEKFSKDNTICTFERKTSYIFANDTLKNYALYPLNSFEESRFMLWISGTTEDQNEQWEVKWKFTNGIRKVSKYKSIIFQQADALPTKMYLINGDDIEVLEEKGDWFNIRYYGKKTIEGWIKKSDVE